jgi:hypothetical protein
MICEHKPGSEIEYKPKSGGTVIYRVGTERDRRRMNVAVAKALKEFPDDDDPARNLVVCEIAVAMLVVSVDGIDGEVGPITNGSDVVEHGSTELLDELAALVLEALSVPETVKEKSEGSPTSAAQATPASNGIATSASQPSSTSTATVTEGATLVMSTQPEEG